MKATPRASADRRYISESGSCGKLDGSEDYNGDAMMDLSNLPSYMLSTGSSEAKRGHGRPKASVFTAKTVKSPLFASPEASASRGPTYSSTLKDCSKFPKLMELRPGAAGAEGITSAVRICRYSYCSLNGHSHSEHSPGQLRDFSASRSKLVKKFRERTGGENPAAPDAIKMPSSAKITSLEEDNVAVAGDFFVEIYAAGDSGDATDEESGNAEAENGVESFQLANDHDCGHSSGDETKPAAVAQKEVIAVGVENKPPGNGDLTDAGIADGVIDDDFEAAGEETGWPGEPEPYDDVRKLCAEFRDMSLGDTGELCGELTDEFRSKSGRLIISRGKLTGKGGEDLREFNPRAPNFLEPEPEEQAEQVDLRHQTPDDKRNAEEWMLDYALRRMVSELAPARKRKVELLVEAYETVVPLHCDDSSPGTPPIRACS